MMEAISGVNLYQPKKITIETKPAQGIDEGVPYEMMQVNIAEEKPGGEQKVLAQYALSGRSEREFEILQGKVQEALKSVYAQEAYAPKAPAEDKNYTPPIGKDGW